jgi:hypothetical protein|tara:strand:+ start:1487 stop:1876 length:390 start_codon:yes stop_codon:yes gene_type:complete
MAVQKITHKKIIKYDTKNPNFSAEKLKAKQKEISGNIQDDIDIYGERKHTYVPDANGNLQMEQLMGKLMNKLDGIPNNSQTGINAIEVDIKREIAIGKVDISAVKSEEFVGKVKTKKDKLKALRKRNGR